MTVLKNISMIKDEGTGYFNFLNEYSKPLVCRNSDHFYGIIDGKGTVIVPFIYEDIVTFGNLKMKLW
ncbi:WG repeat-containing protein [Chryseobacterium arthrosphaerae]|uniref:WG repeat-containing protein n=1 Tax=Chryseobacterium arthrosphaerae TaxID=651561 RepID=A0A3S0VKE0_9FLAO|nr:WG repeat-containing protein [Chryseobacterium arthrosphaerae]